MNVKDVIIFVGGLAVGAAAGILGTRKFLEEKYDKKYKDDIAEMEQYYQLHDKYARETKDYSKEENDHEEEETRPRMTPEERAEIKEKLNRNWEETTNYAGMYHDRDSEETEHPVETSPKEYEVCSNCGYFDPDEDFCTLIEDKVGLNDSCSDFSNRYEKTLEEEAFDEHRKNMNKPPRIISEEAYEDLPPYIDQEILYLFTYDEVLCDENEDEVEEPGRLVGDCLTKYDFVDSDEQTIFVLNYALDTCFTVQKIEASYTDSH